MSLSLVRAPSGTGAPEGPYPRCVSIAVNSLWLGGCSCAQSTGRWAAAGWGRAGEPVVVGAAVIGVQTARFNTARRSLGATALYIKMKSALREKQLEE